MPAFLIVIFTCLLTTIFWEQTIFLPLKLLVVLVHEFAHGFIGLFFSAELTQIEINLLEEGHTVLRNLNSPIGFVLTASAGYLGTTLLGAVFLNRSLQYKNQRGVLVLFAVCLGCMTYLFCQFGGIAFWVGMSFALVFLAACLLCRQSIIHWLLIVLGSFFVWYSFYDLLDFTQHQATDVSILTNYLITNEWIHIDSKSFAEKFIAISWTILIIVIFLIAIVSSLDFHLRQQRELAELADAEGAEGAEGAADANAQAPLPAPASQGAHESSAGSDAPGRAGSEGMAVLATHDVRQSER